MRAAAAAAVVTVAALVVLATSATARARPAATFAAVQGDVTVVAFFATGCAPCKEELPLVEALHESLAGDARVRVVAVSIDERDAKPARRWWRELSLTMPVLVDPRLYAELFGRAGETSVPRLVVMDRHRVGLERAGMRKGEARDGFVREVTAAIASVEAGAPTAPTPMWQLLATSARR